MSSSNNQMFKIDSEGDLEIILLSENQNAFTDIINPDLYDVLGDAPDQSIMFHNDSCFDLFFIRVAEIFSEGLNNVSLGGKNYNFSLFSGAQWLCEKYPSECYQSGLTDACKKLTEWLDTKAVFSFWCSDIGTKFELDLSRRDLISFIGNLTKHNILRLNGLLNKLTRILERNGFSMKEQEVVSVVEPFSAELESRLIYHSSYLTEMLYDYFIAINTLIITRGDIMNTNHVSKMLHPEGVSSDVYKNMYGSVIVFNRYDKSLFSQFRPITTKYLKMRY